MTKQQGYAVVFFLAVIATSIFLLEWTLDQIVVILQAHFGAQ